MKIVEVLRRPYDGPVHPEAVSRYVHVHSNLERRRHGLPPLQRHPGLERVACEHSSSMMAQRFFDHIDPRGQGPQDRVARTCPGLIGAIGENLAQVPMDPDDELGASLVSGWMDSPGHRKNLLDAGFGHLGVGVALDAPYAVATQVFGDLVAELVSPRPPVRSACGSEVSVRLHFLARWPAADLMVWVQSPEDARRSGREGHTCVGGCPVELQWRGDTFEASFVTSEDRGPYRLFFGQRSTELLISASLVVEVD